MSEATTERRLCSEISRESEARSRDDLLGQYRAWAESIAVRIHYRLRHLGVAKDDLKQSAVLGLWEALGRYEPGRGIPLTAFAQARVRGAVFDCVRSGAGGESDAMSPMRRVGERLQSVRRTPEAASGEELFEQVVDDILGLGLIAMLDEAALDLPGGELSAFEYTERSQMQRRLLAAIDGLSERSRLLVKAHYFSHVTFTELAARLQVSKGRVSQLHHAALRELRRVLMG